MYCTVAETQEAAGLIALFHFVQQEMQIWRTESGNHMGALPQGVLHRILEEQSIFTQGIHASQATLLDLVGQGRKELGK